LQVSRSIPFADVEDVVQEAWIRILENLDIFDGKAKLATWARVITRGVVRDYYRVGIKLWRAYHIPGASVTEEVEPEQDREIIFMDLLSKVKSEKQRATLYDRFYLGRGETEQAKMAGVNWNTINMRYRAGIRALREIMEGS